MVTPPIRLYYYIDIGNDNVLNPLIGNEAGIVPLITMVLENFPDQNPIDDNWIISPYAPTPTIIEAARALYENHTVEDITRHEADRVSTDATIGSAEYQPLMEALACVFAAKDFEGALRNVLQLHGDISPVITIAGALAEAYFGIPEGLKARALRLVPDDLLNVIGRFSEITKGFRYDGKKTADMLAGTGMIRLACSFFKEHYDEKETFYRLMGVIRDRMYQNGMFLVSYEGDMTKQDSFNLLTMDHGEEHWLACFTSEEECEKGPKTSAVTIGIDTIFDMIQHEDGIAGVTINPFSDNINVTKEGAWNILTERVTE